MSNGTYLLSMQLDEKLLNELHKKYIAAIQRDPSITLKQFIKFELGLVKKANNVMSDNLWIDYGSIAKKQ